MTTASISWEISEWLATFSEKEAREIIGAAADSVGLRIMELIGNEYPPPPPDQAKYRGKMLRTDKQKAYWWAVMAKIARGEAVPDQFRGWKAAYKKVNGKRTLVISGRYKRTGTLLRSLGYDKTTTRQGAVIRIGPSMAREPVTTKAGQVVASYAEWVLSQKPPRGNQALIHQDRWTPLIELIERHDDELIDLFFAEVTNEINRRNYNFFTQIGRK